MNPVLVRTVFTPTESLLENLLACPGNPDMIQTRNRGYIQLIFRSDSVVMFLTIWGY